MSEPFFYYESVYRVDVVRYEVIVRCANQGYGHRQDPQICRITGARSLSEALEEVAELLPGVTVHGPDGYIAALARRTTGNVTEQSEGGESP